MPLPELIEIEPLTRPVIVTARGKKFTLSADDANLHADVGGIEHDFEIVLNLGRNVNTTK